MLRVGLTGGLGSGKSTVARIFRGLGAHVASSDETARRLMNPGEPVYEAIAARFGPRMILSNGLLDRKALAELAFQHHQAHALNEIIHPAVIAAEREWMRDLFAREPGAIAIVESALLFESAAEGTAPAWSERFDKLILVTAPDEVKIARFVSRGLAALAVTAGTVASASVAPAEEEIMLERDARARLAAQIPDAEKALHCDYVIDNRGPLERLEGTVREIYRQLRLASSS